MDDRYAVGENKQLVEILRDNHHGASLLGEIDERLLYGGNRGRIEPPGRLRHHQHARLLQDFAADNEFLQVAAGQATGQGVGTGTLHAEGRDHLCSEAARRARLQKAAPHQRQPSAAGEEDIVGQREF